MPLFPPWDRTRATLSTSLHAPWSRLPLLSKKASAAGKTVSVAAATMRDQPRESTCLGTALEQPLSELQPACLPACRHRFTSGAACPLLLLADKPPWGCFRHSRHLTAATAAISRLLSSRHSHHGGLKPPSLPLPFWGAVYLPRKTTRTMRVLAPLAPRSLKQFPACCFSPPFCFCFTSIPWSNW